MTLHDALLALGCTVDPTPESTHVVSFTEVCDVFECFKRRVVCLYMTVENEARVRAHIAASQDQAERASIVTLAEDQVLREQVRCLKGFRHRVPTNT